MILLSNETLADVKPGVKLPAYNRADIGVGIVHLGAGAFFKAHQAVYTDAAIEKSGGNWGICAVSLNSISAKETLAPQDGLYTLKIVGDVNNYQVIRSIKEVLAGPENRAKVIVRIADPKIHIITLTITEKGYCLKGDGDLDFNHAGIVADQTGTNIPVTAIGILAVGLAARQKNGGPPIVVISCDNISGNGNQLAGAVLAFSEKMNPKLANWIRENVSFPNTMVDSITPASDRQLLNSVLDALGMTDLAPVHREPFTDWVIENFDGPRPAWEKAGAIFTPDVTPFEHAKLRLVNAPHSALTYLGLIAGHQTVAQAIADKGLSDYFYRLTEHELIPSLAGSPIENLSGYRDRIKARFANKAIHHDLLQIATDGSAKLPQRFLPPLKINRKAGRATKCLSLAIAAWMLYVLDGARIGREINDPMKRAFKEIAMNSTGAAPDDVSRLLALKEIFPSWLAKDEAIKTEIIAAYDNLSLGGVPYALKRIEASL